MIPFLASVQLRTYLYAGAAVLLIGYLGCERRKRSVLEAQLATAQQTLAQIQAESAKTQGRLEVSVQRVKDIDLRTRWLLKEFGAELPKDEEGARKWAIRAAKEIGE